MFIKDLYLKRIFMKYIRTFFLLTLTIVLIGCGKKSDDLKVNILASEMLNNRYFLKFPTESKDTLKMFTDTGGGFDILWKSTFDSLNPPFALTEMRGRTLRRVQWESLRLIDFENSSELVKDDLIVYPAPKIMPDSDGFLGGSFFVNGKIWQFNYVDQTIGTIDTIRWDQRETNQLKMNIQKNDKNEITGIHPALKIVIGNDTLKVLFDTGATMLPSQKGRNALTPKNLPSYAGSYLSSKKIKELHKNHPDWTFIENGSKYAGGADMINIPEIKIGQIKAQNVWFVERPKSNFIKINGKHLDGAIGGNAMKNFKVIADYDTQVFEFEI